MQCIEYCPPPDKSIAIRAIILAAFANGRSRIINAPECDDAIAAMECVRSLGAYIDKKDNCIEIEGGCLHEPRQPLFCGSSGTLARLLCGIISGSGMAAEISGSEQLSNRPMRRITEPLRRMGAIIEGDSLPIRIIPSRLHGICYEMPVASAQVKTAILFAGINADGITAVKEPYLSRNHGENMLRVCGVSVHTANLRTELGKSALNPFEIEIPGDFSSAAFFIAAAQISRKYIKIKNTSLNPSRTGMLRVMERSGASFFCKIQNKGPEPTGTVMFSPTYNMRPFFVSREEMPQLIDEIPTMAVMAATIPGKSVFLGADELKVKESDRISASIRLVEAMGAKASYEGHSGGCLCVYGKKINSAEECYSRTFNAADDHRMAMAATVAKLICPGLKIQGTECVSKSYPGFFPDFSKAFLQLLTQIP